MSNYFSGDERLETFKATGALMRMGDVSKLNVPDYIILKELIEKEKWENALAYLDVYYAQNTGMIGLLGVWCTSMSKLYEKYTSSQNEKSIRLQAIDDYQNLITLMGHSFPNVDDQNILVQMKNYFSEENLQTKTTDEILGDLAKSYNNLKTSLEEKNKVKALSFVTPYHHRALIYHDSLITYTYSYPTTVLKNSGEAMGVKVGCDSIMENVLWNGMWELTKSLTPLDLAAFLTEHLRTHFSGMDRLGQCQVVEDDKKIRLIFDPCGSGGALRRRLKDDIVNLKEEHQLGWNKRNEVNIYCSHCALNEKKSIDIFGYPKLVVEFQSDASKPCGWTIYKNKEDIPAEVYTRLGYKK